MTKKAKALDLDAKTLEVVNLIRSTPIPPPRPDGGLIEEPPPAWLTAYEWAALTGFSISGAEKILVHLVDQGILHRRKIRNDGRCGDVRLRYHYGPPIKGK